MAPPAAYPGRVLIVAVLLFVLALVVGAVGVAALTGKLPRNRWAGVRTPDALRDDEAFALANKVAAPSMLGPRCSSPSVESRR